MAKEYIFKLDNALYNEETGEAVFKPQVVCELIRCVECEHRKQSTDITYNDIVFWEQGIEESAKLVYFKSNDAEKLRDQLSKRCADLGFLVTFVKSLLTIDVDQEVYDATRDYKIELQDRMKSIFGKENEQC